MLEFSNISEGHMKQSQLNMDSLTKPELLMLFSVLEGELEARDLVIDALKAQRRELFIQERYGCYSLSDPFLALQRDREAMGGPAKEQGCDASASNPLVVLKLVVSHCRRMQEKMLAQLAAAESRHRRVIADLEEEKRRHAEDTAEGDDVTYILEKERERLQQQLDFERSQVRRLEKEQRRMVEQLEEERAQHKQLSCALAKECKWASARVLEESHRMTELNRKLEKERDGCHALRTELEDERRRALRMEARVEEQLAEFDTEREQLRSRLKKEEAHCGQLQRQVEELEQQLREANMARDARAAEGKGPADAAEEGGNRDGVPRVNGHLCSAEGQQSPDGTASEKMCQQNGGDGSPPRQIQTPAPVSPSASPSPVQAKHPSPYQAGINQRFHAARHKFQGAAEPELQPLVPAATPPLSQRDSSPVAGITAAAVDATSPVKQMARSTVTQVLSRFTTAQQGPAAKLATPNNSPFGTDYRSLATPLSPVIGRAAAAAAVGAAPPPAGIRSPTISRADRGNPPPIPPKKPGLAQAPTSPAASPAASPRSGSCGLTSSQDAVKELDVVVSSN